jgi:hypothetical protein
LAKFGFLVRNQTIWQPCSSPSQQEPIFGSEGHFSEVIFWGRKTVGIRVARWFVFKPKILIWVNFGGSCLLYFMTIWPILRPLEIFYGHLIYFVAISYIFPRFGILDKDKSGNPGRN